MTYENIPEGPPPPAPNTVHQPDVPPSVEYGIEEQSEITGVKPGPDLSPERPQEQTMGAALLSGMRNYLCSTGNRPIAANAQVPPRSSGPLNQLYRISQSRDRPAEQIEAVDPLDVKRLFLNIHAYTVTEKPRLLGQLHTLDVLRQVYEPYLADVMRFREMSISRAVFMALRHPASLLDRINEQFEAYDYINKGTFVTAFRDRPHAPEKALEELVVAVEHFKTEIEPRLRATYDGEGTWDSAFIRLLVQSPFNTEMAARAILQHAQDLRHQYPHIQPERITAFAETQLLPRRNPALAAAVATEMRESTASDKVEQSMLEEAREKLNRIRLTTDRPRITRGTHSAVRQSPLMAELTYQANQRRNTAFTALNDIRFETLRLEAYVNAYNDSLHADEVQLKIGLDIDTLYEIFLAYALDVGVLKEKGYGLGATTVAWYHDSGVYDRYIAEYEGREGATAEEIVAAIQYRPTQIDKQMEGLLIRKRMEL